MTHAGPDRSFTAPTDTPVMVLAIVVDEASRSVFPKVIPHDRLRLATDLAEGLALAQAEPPDLAFVDVTIGDGAGLAMVHHLKAVAPEVTVFALATPLTLQAGAHAVALGGAGLFMLPLAGDEILSAVAAVRARRAEVALRAKLEVRANEGAAAAAYATRVAEIAEATDRSEAARQLAALLTEATGAQGAAVYLAIGEGATELARTAVSPSLERAPAFGAEMDVLEFARRERLLVVPLALRKLTVGHALLLSPTRGIVELAPGGDGEPRPDALVRLLATQATTALALIGERDRMSGGGAIKDPASSAYSFAYYVDVAGREIDKARRHGRRFAIATVALEPQERDGRERGGRRREAGRGAAVAKATITPAEMADQLLKAMRDTDVLARVDEYEFHLLLPETDGLGAHACRRRVLARLPVALASDLLCGVATFPHDGQNLAQLLRKARRRAEATRASIVHRLSLEQGRLADILDLLEWDASVAASPSSDIGAARPLDLAIPDAVALATTVVADALRGGAAFLAVAHHPNLSLGAAVRASIGPGRENVVLHALDVRSSPDCEDIEALSVISEHGAYALIGRNQGGVVRGVHAADPLLADLLAERLGRAVGLRVFG